MINSLYNSIFFLFLAPIYVFSQSGIITVKDAVSQEVLPNSHLVFTDIKTDEITYAMTDSEGNTQNLATSKSTLKISYTGFVSILDTINLGISKTYLLKEDVFNLDQVVITATKTRKTLKNVPVLTQIITAKQIEKRGFQNAMDVLTKDIPLIETQLHAYGTTLNMQGLKPVNILILIDGERIAGEFRGNIDYSRLNTQDIERIEIIKGASSALYGSQAMGAVINIITKKPKENFYASLSSQFSSSPEKDFPNLKTTSDDYNVKKNLDRINLNQNYMLGFNLNKWSGKTSLVFKTKDAHQLKGKEYVEAHYFNLDTFVKKPVEMYPMSVNGFKDYTFSQSLDYKLSEQITVQANASYYKHDDYDYLNDNKYDRFDSYTFNTKADYIPNDKSSYTLSWHTDIYNKYDFFVKLDSTARNYKHQFHNPKLTGNYQLNDKQQLTAGVEFLNESLLSDRFNLSEVMQEKSVSTATFFLQDDITFSEQWNSIIGLRTDYHTSYGMHLSPKLSVMYKLYPFTFRTNLASGYRSPNLKELYMDWNMAGILIIRGSEDIKPETNRYISISTEFTKPKINTSVSVYYNAFKNKIEGVFSDDFEVYNYQNTSSATLFGVDYHLHYQPIKSFFVKMAYSYVTEENRAGFRLSVPSPHSASLQFGYNYRINNYKLSVNLNGKYTGKKEVVGQDEIHFQGSDTEAYYRIKYPDYSMWRLSIHQKYKNYIDFNFSVQNLFNYKPKAYAFNTPITFGRQYNIGIKLYLSNFFITNLNK